MKLNEKDKIILNYINMTNKYYLTKEEFLNFIYYLNENENIYITNYSFNEFLDNNNFIIKGNENYDNLYIPNIYKFVMLLSSNHINEDIQKSINNYINYLKGLTKYVLFPIKGYAKDFWDNIYEETIHYIIVKAYVLEKYLKYEWLSPTNTKYKILFSNPDIVRLNESNKLGIPKYIIDNWVDKIIVENIFNTKEEAQKIKQIKNDKIKTSLVNYTFTKDASNLNKIMNDYHLLKEKYDKLEELILEEQRSLKLIPHKL